MSTHTESESSLKTSDLEKREMFETFHSWAIKNYGDSGKTKTVTRKKYDRIVKILSGEEQYSSGNSKFRFWVKAKGFRLGPIPGNSVAELNDERLLYVPTKQVTDDNCNDVDKGYKRVAIVEDFFDIIYNVHVEMDGRGGKHAGQKRTYRAIAETYAFLPREAVTRFLMSCTDCQKRMHLSNDNTSCNGTSSPPNGHVMDDPPIIDFSVPITQTYLNHIRNRGFMSDSFNDEESMSSGDSELSRERTPSPVPEDMETTSPSSEVMRDSVLEDRVMAPVNLTAQLNGQDLDGKPTENEKPLSIISSKLSPSPKLEDRGHNERKRRASNESADSSTRASEAGTVDMDGCKDDEDDDDNDDDEKVLSGGHDPERLKSFNMFVRLFVDENLDRMVPISKQPKDKVQAILEACDRQFPEFHERSRKRIRTYLKSCRRMRRSKDQNGWEPIRPTPPHLTSAAAESILAQACENESSNAKRMRMGLEPLPASVMQSLQNNNSSGTNNSSSNTATPINPSTVTTPQPQPTPTTPSRSSPQPQSQPSTPSQVDRHVPSGNDFIRHQPPPPAFRPPPEFHPPFFPNGNGLFRPGFPASYTPPAHHHPAVIQHTPLPPTSIQNGPTDLSMKKSNSKNQLSSSEITTIKQLIAGYRESAAFLYRSADELEQLLLQQN